MANMAAVMNRLGSIDIEERPEPVPGPADVVIEIRAVGICGSDITYFTHGRIGQWIVDGPIVLGHEASGVVIDCGPEVQRVKAGDRVAIEPGVPCDNCRECRRGDYHLCADLAFLATPPYDGALVQRLRMPERCVYPIPDSMTFEQGALAEPLSVGLWACRRSGLRPGEDVLVTGAGPVGILAGCAALALGARTVTIVDVSDFRLSIADRLGLRAERPSGRADPDHDVLIECSSAQPALTSGLRRLRPGGRAALVGVPKTELAELPLAELVPQEVTLALVNRYAHTWPTAIALLAGGRVPSEHLVSHHFPLEATAEAFTLPGRSQDSLKIVIEPQRLAG
ncbi:NAD(P)-dependent alcohol dehydrogenase [Nonomuraea insulae]|uniref:NAD(P)-dependent alcohol dehydrogenase n=1 Tax=Nonomuraea insulae TaxID=1616787 RepID=A0ABW1CNN4_9ACTN